MKKTTRALIWALAPLQMIAIANANTLTFVSSIDAAQSGTSSDASGSAILTLDTQENTLDITIQISDLSNDLTASHLHAGATGETGDVIINIGDMSAYTVIGDLYILEQTDVAVPAESLADLLAGDTYLNFHTAENPAGEVRGQVDLSLTNEDTIVNISTRGLIDPANGNEANLIAGFSIIDTKRVILRAIGETLGSQGVNDPLEDVSFNVFKLDFNDPSNTANIGSNDNWKEGGQQFQIEASGLAPLSESDSAMIFTLDEGTYTLNAEAVSGEGIALVEVFGLENSGIGSTINDASGQSFSILDAALQATGLDVILDGPGPYTLFAPTDAAFLDIFTEADLAELLADDADQDDDLAALTEILLYHVIGANIPASALAAGPNGVVALNGVNFTVTVGDEGVTAQNGNVVETDIPASNGVIHVVDAVLEAFNLGSELNASGSFSILNAAVSAAGLSGVLDGEGPFTIFAPTDAAFLAAFTQEELDELLADDEDQAADLAALAEILSYHVISDLILASDIADGTVAVPALTGLGLNVTRDGSTVTVQGASVTDVDILVGNGVIHQVDAILAPFGIGSTLAAGGTEESFTILSAALAATGLDAALDGEGAFTLFAPDDDAFLAIFTAEELDELLADDADQAEDLADLAAILSFHVVPSQILSTDLAEGVNTATTLTGADIYVTLVDGTVTVQDGTVDGPDILAANGVIHAVDSVLAPYGIGSTIASGGTAESFTILAAALEATGLDVALDADGSFTLFAPNDAAFLAAFTQEELDELLADDADMADDLDALADILSYHVLPVEILSTDLAEGVNAALSLTGTNVFVTLDEGTVTAQDATVIDADITTANGVIHAVDGVLAPFGVGTTIATGGLSEDFTILAAALDATNLMETLDGAGPFTLFAPTDEAFLAAFTQEELNELLADDADQAGDLAIVSGILIYHIVMENILSTDLSAGVNTFESLNFAEIDITVAGDDVTVQNGELLEADILANDGVIHIVDAVLVP